MEDVTPANEDDGQVFTQPNLSLSVADILSRWERNLPLDVITRNGSYLLEGDEEDFDAADIDRMDLAEANDYLEQRANEANEIKKRTNHNRQESKPKEEYSHEPAIGETTKEAETPAD